MIKKTIIIITLIIVAIIFFIISKHMQTTITVKYKEQSNLNYKVYLKNNNYYEQQYLEKDMHYIANLIDYIYINFNYDFKSNENISYTYKYYIEAELTIYEKNKASNVIFKKKDKLAEDVIEKGTASSQININEDITIDYEKYDDLVKMFKADYNISADSNLKIALYIETDVVFEELEYSVRINSPMKLTIPLTEQTLNITTDYKEINEVSNPIITSNMNITKNILLSMSGISGILGIILTIKLLISIYKIKNSRSMYEKTMKKILKNYDRVIVKLKKEIPIYNEKDVIEVINFEELLDVSDRLNKPILLIEIDKNKKSWFIVKNIEDIYRYELEEKDLELGKKRL